MRKLWMSIRGISVRGVDIRSSVIFGIVAIACGLSLSACTPNSSRNAPLLSAKAEASSPPSVSFEGNPPAWATTATTVMRQLEEWRGLPFTEDVQVTFESQADPGLNGWYNSETKQLSVTTEASEQLGQSVLLHEMFHALQDQQFDLYNLHLQSMNVPDYDKAVSALIEGEAMLAVSELMNYNFLDHARLPDAGPISEEFFQNIFLYGEGLRFIQAIRDEGGWAAVDQAFQDPPQSTALILNPARYIAGEREAQLIEVPLQKGETLQTNQVRGEYEVQWLIAANPDTRTQLPAFAESYMADTFGMVTTAEGRTAHRWVVELDSSESAMRLKEPFEEALLFESGGMPVTILVDQSLLIAEW
ncbi:MAG: hypothetical protein AAFR25_05745 [Cyanobacteria bacterium J06629_19]